MFIRCQVTYVVNHPEDSWEGEKGFITEEVIARHLFPPGDGVKIVVCGPWKMCQIMKSLLKEMGYTEKVTFLLGGLMCRILQTR